MTKSKRLPERTRKLDPSELARLVRENAEALFKDLAGEDFHRAFNPDRPPRRKVVLTLIAVVSQGLGRGFPNSFGGYA